MLPLIDGKVVDITGPGRTDRFGVTATDLGASVIAPNGKLVSVFGDTFSGSRVGQGDWRSPVVLIGTGDANHEIIYESAGEQTLTTRGSCGTTSTTTRHPGGGTVASAL